MFCSCGCGKEIKMTKLIKWKLKNGQKNFYIKGHFPKGDKHHSWKGGKTVDDKGYRFIRDPFHPNSRKNGYVAEAHLVMSEYLGRPINTKTEVVHHINGNKIDNRLENLVVIKRTEHPKIHFTGSNSPVWKEKIPKTCPTCGKKFIASYGNHKRNRYCSRKCITKSGGKKYTPHVSQNEIKIVKALSKEGFGVMKIARITTIERHTVSRILKHLK